MKSDKYVVDNIVYMAVAAESACKGCAGRGNDELCDQLPACGSVVWVRHGEQPASAKNLRDEFAMAALGGLLADHAQFPPSTDPLKKVSALSYAIADAMLAAREQK